jgi:poly(3-hydroxybutyrate) depolymerase
LIRAGAAALGLAALAFGLPVGAGTLALPETACQRSETIWRDSFEADAVQPTDPSHGSGGAAGNLSLLVTVPGWPLSEIYLHVPPAYKPERSWPVLLALHGASGSHDLAIAATAQARSDWSALADEYGFIVVAPVGIGSLGSWITAIDANDHPSDYDVFVAALAQVEAAYNVERTRIYGWGFSAGGHVMHDLAVRGFAPALDSEHLAAYGVDAGALQALACANLTPTQCGNDMLAAMPRRIPVALEVGKSDPLLSYVRNDRQQLRGHGWVDNESFFYREFSGGHQYSTTELADIWKHLCRIGVAP